MTSLATPELGRSKSTKGRWVKGQSGNPGGRKKTPENITQLARDATPRAFRTLVAIMDDNKASANVRAYCAERVIERAYGKPLAQTNLNISTSTRTAAMLSDDELAAIIARGQAQIEANTKLITVGSGGSVDNEIVDVEPAVEPELGIEADASSANGD